MHATHWKLASFDLDGTLVPRGSTGQHIAAKLGHLEAMREIERRYAAGEATNADVVALDGRYYEGLTTADVTRLLEDIPVIDDIAKTVDWLGARGTSCVICTLAWKPVGEVFAERYGFMASSGPTLQIGPGGAFTGEVESDFAECDKPTFVASLCRTLDIGMSEVFHVGDARSDIPLFGAVGYSVALNATPEAQACASASVDSDSLFDVLRAVPGLRAG
jgi:phosphoserine phosphatase